MAMAIRRPEGVSRIPERWVSFRDLEELLESTLSTAGPPVPGEMRPWVPPVDIEETEDAWIVEAELPGVRPEDVNLEVQENEVAITGEIKERERQGILRRHTRRVGQFELRVSLPGPIDSEAIEASLDDGVLRVRIPRADQSRPHRIEVRGGHGAGTGTDSGQATGGGQPGQPGGM